MRNKASIVARSNSERSARRLHLVASNTDSYSVSDEIVTAADASEEDDEKTLEHGAEPELTAHPIGGIDDLVGLYLREMGVTPMLTRDPNTGKRNVAAFNAFFRSQDRMVGGFGPFRQSFELDMLARAFDRGAIGVIGQLAQAHQGASAPSSERAS